MSFLRDLFWPHHDNNHKAHLIKSYAIFLLALVFAGLQFGLNFFLAAKPAVLGYSSNITPERIVELTNVERVKLGLPPLKVNALLSEAAREKAADMFAFNYWAHVSPSGRTPWSFFNDVGYKYQYAGENLARDFRDPDSVVRAWMNSPSHRENIVNSKYQEIGVAVVDGTLQGAETTLVVQLFGTQYGAAPAAKSQPPAAPNTQPAEEKVPVKAPLETPVQVPSTSREVLAQGENPKAPLASPLDLTKGLVILVVGILLGVFAADIFLVPHHVTPRLSSKSLAQMMFLIFILAASLLISQGAIL